MLFAGRQGHLSRRTNLHMQDHIALSKHPSFYQVICVFLDSPAPLLSRLPDSEFSGSHQVSCPSRLY